MKTSHKGFCLATLEILIMDWPRVLYLVIKITPRVPSVRPLLEIEYKYNYRRFLEYISTEGYGSTEPGDPYLSRFPDIYSNVSVCPIVLNNLLGRYFNACSTMYNNNRM